MNTPFINPHFTPIGDRTTEELNEFKRLKAEIPSRWIPHPINDIIVELKLREMALERYIQEVGAFAD